MINNFRLSTGAQWGRFAVNCLIGWMLPALNVIGVAVIDRLDVPEIPFQFKPGFGNSQVFKNVKSKKNLLNRRVRCKKI